MVYLQLLSNITTYFRTISHKLMNLDISFTVQISPIKNTQGETPTSAPETNGFISKTSVPLCFVFHNDIRTSTFILIQSSRFFLPRGFSSYNNY